MDQRQKLEMMSLYKKAIDASAPLLDIDEESLVGVQMSMIVREMLPLLHIDHMALEMADIKQSMPLPEIIDMGRTQVVDIGDQPLKTESGASNTRQKIRIENGKDVVEGYFTPNQTVDSEKDYKAFLDEMEKKYDPIFKPFIDRFREFDTEDVYNDYAIPYGVELINTDEMQGMSVEDKKNEVKNTFVTNLWRGANVGEDDIEKASGNI